MNRTILLEEERNRSEGERKRKFLIQHACQQERTQRVTLINHNGITVKCYPQALRTKPMVCNVQATTIEEVSVICEYPNVSAEELPKMPPDRDL